MCEDNIFTDDEDEDSSTTTNTNKRQRNSKSKGSKRQKMPSGYEPDVDVNICSDVVVKSSEIDYSSNEDCWEVSDFCSTDDSDDEWTPDL